MFKSQIIKILSQKYVYSLTAFFCIALSSAFVYADWQSVLESKFDIVSTFDDLDDWIGTGPSTEVTIQAYPNEFPKKIGGGNSIWQYYYVSEAPDTNYKWIANHGPENVWGGTGKSAIIDYNYGSDGIKRGPQRLAFKIGDSPDDGYDEIYLFYMTKWDKNFFKFEDGKPDSFVWVNFLKTLDISAGFRNVRQFGTTEEYNWLLANGANTQVLNEYGLNGQIYNYFSYGTTPNRTLMFLCAQFKANGTTNNDMALTEISLTSTNVGTSILKSEWLGVEIRVKSSNPHGASNGEIEIWTYNTLGIETSHQLLTNIVTLRDGKTPFNHKWNKFVWGGNRFAGPYCDGDPLCQFGPVDHFYLDDVIVHSSRIGIEYFNLFNNNKVSNVPGPARNTKVTN